ncbi:family 16 glycoside hydrolase [Dictyobacter arantiisoli]|uniref:3-keto-alpha-glucoside-1,2-lyase/3-keto-2-hydroxy-glucal hydratase domain-containing protein n=1 Tax=Dictyobacter arantiisoli TaxID=2014874 RepID=A0A5A5THH2_9CHLR|nr:family 16 glycoside hydrolase [Dictyobacter arantiisoli]GCF10658.1 hypothetical protein KDI_42220 [Dictyobacter arantiisoli]
MGSKKKQQRNPLKWLVCLALILLVLISSAIFTSRIQSVGDVHVSATATSSVLATETKPARHATSTATPTPSPSPSAGFSPSDSGTPFATPAPLFTENFLDNHNGWATTGPDGSAGYTRIVGQNKMTLGVTNHKVLIENVPTTTLSPLSDYTLSATFNFLKADGNDTVGLYLRGDSNLDHDYRIDISGNNIVTITKEYLDSVGASQELRLASITKNTNMHPLGQQNSLKVEMNGPRMTLWINDIQIQQLSDPDYTHGQIALFINNGWSSDQSSVEFTGLDISSIPDPLPDATPTPTPTPAVTPGSTPTGISTSGAKSLLPNPNRHT